MERAHTTFVDRMGVAAETDGMSPIAGRLFALLLLADEPLSLDELAERLGVSKASVSTDARRLLERGITERVTRSGDRRDYYELSPDFFARLVRSRLNRWRRMQTLTHELQDAASLSPVVRRRFASIDEIEASVLTPLDQALDESQRRGDRPTPAARHSRVAPRKR